jgi:hypothetical protein
MIMGESSDTASKTVRRAASKLMHRRPVSHARVGSAAGMREAPRRRGVGALRGHRSRGDQAAAQSWCKVLGRAFNTSEMFPFGARSCMVTGWLWLIW